MLAFRPSARLSFVAVLVGVFLPVSIALAPLMPLAPSARAETLAAPPAAIVEHTRAQRIISDDPLLDRSLVATVLPPRFDPRWPAAAVITTYFGEVGPLSPRAVSVSRSMPVSQRCLRRLMLRKRFVMMRSSQARAFEPSRNRPSR